LTLEEKHKKRMKELEAKIAELGTKLGTMKQANQTEEKNLKEKQHDKAVNQLNTKLKEYDDDMKENQGHLQQEEHKYDNVHNDLMHFQEDLN